MPEEIKIAQAEEKVDEKADIKFKGKYIEAIGRRKTSVAVVRLYKKGVGGMMVNGKKMSEYFSADRANAIRQPLKLTGLSKDIDFSIIVKGGGPNGQAEAIRHGITRVLMKYDENTKLQLKTAGFLTRDARKKERKKPGLKKARRAPQWSKR